MTKKDFEPYAEVPPEKKTSWDKAMKKIRELPVNWCVIYHSNSRNSLVSLMSKLKKKHKDFKFEIAPANDEEYFKLFACKISEGSSDV